MTVTVTVTVITCLFIVYTDDILKLDSVSSNTVRLEEYLIQLSVYLLGTCCVCMHVAGLFSALRCPTSIN